MFRNTDPSKEDCLNGVQCSASHCIYHGMGNSCHANNIKVGTEYASDKDETFCSTFTPDAQM